MCLLYKRMKKLIEGSFGWRSSMATFNLKKKKCPRLCPFDQSGSLKNRKKVRSRFHISSQVSFCPGYFVGTVFPQATSPRIQLILLSAVKGMLCKLQHTAVAHWPTLPCANGQIVNSVDFAVTCLYADQSPLPLYS